MLLDHEKSSQHIIQSFEADQLKNRSWIILIADWLTSSFGSITFFVFNILLFTFWILINIGEFKGIPVFDPYPFILLTMTVSLEAIILSIVVLMSQNKQSQISTLREEMDMQVNLIAEREITMALKVLDKIAEKMDIDIINEEFEHMIEETDLPYIQRQLQNQLEDEAKKIKFVPPVLENQFKKK